MRADLCRAIRRRRRRRGPKARTGVAGLVRQARASHLRPELHGLARAPREAPALSGQARARRSSRARSASCSSPAARSSSGCSRRRCAASTFPTRCRAATSSISISPTTSTFLVEDEHTKIIVCLVEGIRRPQAFMAAGGKALAGRQADPAGQGRAQRTRQGGGQSHTGAIAADDQGVRRGLPEVRHRALPLARRPHRNRTRLQPGPPAERQPHRHGLLFGRRQGPGARLRQRRRRRDGAAHARDAGEAARHDRSRPRWGKSLATSGRRSACRRTKFAEICKVVCADPTVDLVTVQGLMPVNPGDPYNPEPLRRAGLDRQAGAGLRPHRAERLRRQPEVPERNRRALHPRPARNRARAAGPGPLRGGAAARRQRNGGAARTRRESGWRGLRCAARGAWADDAEERARQDAGRSGSAGRPHRLSGRSENRFARGKPQDRGRRRHARAARCRGGAGRRGKYDRAACEPRSARPRRGIPRAGDGRRASR